MNHINPKYVDYHLNFAENLIKIQFFQGILTYGKYGLIIDILTNIFSNISTLKSNPTGTIKSIFSNFNLRFFKFLVLYSGLYKVSIYKKTEKLFSSSVYHKSLTNIYLLFDLKNNLFYFLAKK